MTVRTSARAAFSVYPSLILALAAMLLLAAGPNAARAQIDGDLLPGLKARAIGPATMSGRIAAIDAVESDPNIIYVGSATGGVWKSVNGGLNWTPIFDDEGYASIGAVAVFQANPDIVWVGTGEGNVRNSTSIGGGMYKSVDAGRTWQLVGLAGSERINRIALHPTNPNIAYAAALGTLWGENEERGVYKTVDGGKTWRRVLYVDPRTGATDVKIDPSNPNKLYAAMWQFRRWPYHFKSGGPGSGLYVSLDGGETWQERTEEDGLPKGEKGRMVVSMSRANPKIVYALVEAEKSAVIRSDDGGATWHTVNDENGIANRPFYYMELLSDPADPETIYNVASNVSKSIDGGKTFERIKGINCCSAPNAVHIDTHAMWVNQGDPRHLIVGNDGGLAISRDGGATWRFVSNLPLGQYYHVNVDNDVPYNIYGGLQDNGTFRGPSEVWENGGIRNFHWQEIGFGDGFDASPDPEDSMQGYSMSQGGSLNRWNLRTGELYSIRPGPPSPETELRFNWNAGFAQSPHDAATIYYGSQFVHKSTDRGRTWTIISGDLTSNNPDWQTYKTSGGLTPDVTAAENFTTIVAIAVSPLDANVIWVGSDDGRVHVTRDGGATWTSVEGRVRGVPKGTWVPHIEASPHDAGVAFVVFDDHRRSNMATYIYRAENYGQRWRSLGAGNLRGYALSVQQDPIDSNLLFLGTELGLYVSTDDGGNWFKWTQGVPTVSVMDMAIQARENDLVLGTHGRSLFVIDDYSVLRGLKAANFAGGLKILGVTDGQQYVPKQSPSTRFDASGGFRAPNEPYGVAVTFMATGDDLALADEEAERARKMAQRKASGDGEEDKDKPKRDKVTIEVRDAGGALIRTFKAPVFQGVNRVVWGHEADGFRMPAGDTPPEDPDVLPPGAEVPPGRYSLTLRLGDAEASVEAGVLADPRYEVALAEHRALVDFQQHVMALARAGVTAIEALRAAAADIDAISKRAGEAKKSGGNGEALDALNEDGKALKEKVEALEKRFWAPPDTVGYVYDEDKVMGQVLGALYETGGTFRAPTPAMEQYLARAEGTLTARAGEVNALFAGEVAAFRERAAGLGLVLLAAPQPLSVPAR